MPITEEVDEIDSYLKLRKQRQERGEIPKPDYSPPFVKKFGAAIFGKKDVPKTALQSMQPTYASAQAQAAMRKQIDDVMREKEPSSDASIPSMGPGSSKPATARVASTSGEVRMPGLSARTPSVVSPSSPAPPTITPVRPRVVPAPSPVPVTRVASPYSTRAPAPSPTPPRVIVSAPAPPRSFMDRIRLFFRGKSPVNDDARTQEGAVPSKKSFEPVVPLNSVARKPGYVPIDPIRAPLSQTPARDPKSLEPISAVSPPRAPMPVAMVPPTSPRASMNVPPSSAPRPADTAPSSAGSAAPASYAPPWVERKIVSKSTGPPSISEVMSEGKLSDLPWISAHEAARQTAYESYVAQQKKKSAPEQKSVPARAASIDSMSRPRTDARASIPLPAPAPSDAAVHPFVSGEVKVQARPARATNEFPMSTRDQEKEEELTEEEALERLPFEDVEGLSDSDIDYLDRKEQEHRAQRKKLEEDYVAPQDLKSQLEKQAIRMQTVLQDQPPVRSAPSMGNPPSTDEKQEILRRLKKMMEEEGP